MTKLIITLLLSSFSIQTENNISGTITPENGVWKIEITGTFSNFSDAQKSLKIGIRSIEKLNKEKL